MRNLNCVFIALGAILTLAAGPARPDEADDAFRAGVRLLEAQKPREAAEFFVKVARLRPDYPEVFGYLGDAWLQLKRYEEAMASYRRSLEIDRPGKECLRALNGVGCACLGLATGPRKEELIRQAIATFDQAIKVSPKFAAAYHNRGRAFHLKKDLDRAIADFSRAIELDSNPDAFENRGRAWKDAGDDKRAEADFAKAHELREKKK